MSDNPYLKMDYQTRNERLPKFIEGCRQSIKSGDKSGHYGGSTRSELLQLIAWAEEALADMRQQPQSELDALRADNARLRNLLRDVLASADSTDIKQIDYIVGSKAIDAVREALGDE